jgi:DNA repair protein RecN (Recombination protein N)
LGAIPSHTLCENSSASTVLDELAASNLGLIESVSITLGEGLTVVTGETGAGKTLMLGALRLLRGDAATKGHIGPHGDDLDVSARFVDGAAEQVVRRTVSSSRSKAYLDGAISTASALADEVGPRIAIVGQHDQHTITSTAGVRYLVDRLLDEKGSKAKEAWSSAWSAYVAVTDEAAALGTDLRALEREREMLRFQVAEIDDANFAPGDEEDLRSVAGRLRSAESLALHVDTAMQALGDDGASTQLSAALGAIRSAATLDASLGDVDGRIDELIIILSELLSDLGRYGSLLTSAPGELAATEARLADLGSLKRKYGDTVDDILTFRKDASERSDHLHRLLTAAEDIGERMTEAQQYVGVTGLALTEARVRAAGHLASAATVHLADLGFSDPVVDVSVIAAPPAHHGADTAVLLFASDASLKTVAASSVASGGELSRLVLALTLAAGGADAEIVAFDEIDSGIGGSTALAMGRKLASLAESRQVVCVTHLPQVAAFGASHLVVERNGTVATVSPVTGVDRVTEISRMLAGLSDSDVGQQHAAELLDLAHSPTS